MHGIAEIFSNRVLLCAAVAWLIAQISKIPTYWYLEKKLDWKRFFGAGGMPSSHTAAVVSLTIMVGSTQGFDSAVFAASFVLASIVMYDAMGVRRETGTQAQIINKIVRNIFIDGKPITNDDLKELVGHTPIEVACGAILGIVVALCFLYI